MIKYDTLNTGQREAVFSIAPRILCLAGAGTGKTQVLTRRIARLWETGVKPVNMLALTFTRAAGEEMKERVIGLIGNDGKGLFCNTFHAFCVEIIREYAHLVKLDSNFSIYDQDESDEVINEVLRDLKLKITAKKFNDFRAGKAGGIPAVLLKQAKVALNEYWARLTRSNAVDFDRLIELVETLLKEKVAVQQALNARYRYVFVDEFQDTDSKQWGLINAMNPNNLFIVGDDNQAIYGFRGGEVDIILSLSKSPDWQTVKLEQNYRSTRQIITAANALIQHNNQTDKILIANKEGVPIDFREPLDEEREISDIAERLMLNLRQNKSTAILARTNRQIDRVMEYLKERSIPYERLASTESPLSTKGAKDVFTWLTLITNPDNNAALRKIASQQLGKHAYNEAEMLQLRGNLTFGEALNETVEGRNLLQQIDERRESFKQGKWVSAGVASLFQSLEIDGSFVVPEVIKWEQRSIMLGESSSVSAFLDYVMLCSISAKPIRERDSGKVYLMTAHGSKGLEFEEVFVIGVAKGMFPSGKNIEEERRLFYVAITRAREYLNVSCPKEIIDWSGGAKLAERSGFITEALIEKGML